MTHRHTQVHRRHLGDTLTALSVLLVQEDEYGDELPADLTGAAVTFKMLDADGNVVIAETGSGVVVDADPTTGKVDFDFPSAGVTTPGVYRSYFVATTGGETDHFPVAQGELVIVLEAD